ncbi:MAG: HAMP domain-containing sensor histidine kinase [Treponema sp.]|nr:HAMP domain-containing sensor histidine kinase [Treponema sp.]
MGRKILKSFSIRLSLRFMLLISAVVLLMSVFFVFVVNNFVKRNLALELNKAMSEAILAVNTNSETDLHAVPYFLSYVVYEKDTKRVVASNDPFLPLLQDTDGKAKKFFVRDYFYDGNLDIFYVAREFSYRNILYTAVVSMNMDSDTSSEIYQNLPKAILFIVVPILLVSFLISLFIARKTIEPVVKITRSAEKFSLSDSTGTNEIENFLPVSGYDDEIDQLSKTFNELFKRLKRDFDRERQFSSDVSHELNTPLTVISGQTNLLLRWGKDEPMQLEKSLAAIRDETRSMHAIISNLLQISRIESGRIKPNFSNVRLNVLFKRLLEEVKSYSPNSELTFSCGEIELCTDEEMLHQILTVLISNSVKFADKKCIVELRAEKKSDGKVVIEEEDNGPGLKEKDLPHIFQRFYRGDESHTRKVGGSGLGLSIAQTLVTALGGTISAKNASTYGAVFTIVLP